MDDRSRANTQSRLLSLEQNRRLNGYPTKHITVEGSRPRGVYRSDGCLIGSHNILRISLNDSAYLLQVSVTWTFVEGDDLTDGYLKNLAS